MVPSLTTGRKSLRSCLVPGSRGRPSATTSSFTYKPSRIFPRRPSSSFLLRRQAMTQASAVSLTPALTTQGGGTTPSAQGLAGVVDGSFRLARGQEEGDPGRGRHGSSHAPSWKHPPLSAVGPKADSGTATSCPVVHGKGDTKRGRPSPVNRIGTKAVKPSCHLPFSVSQHGEPVTENKRQGLNVAALPFSPVSASACPSHTFEPSHSDTLLGSTVGPCVPSPVAASVGWLPGITWHPLVQPRRIRVLHSASRTKTRVCLLRLHASCKQAKRVTTS